MLPFVNVLAVRVSKGISSPKVTLNIRTVRWLSSRRSLEKRRNFLAYGAAALAGIASVWWVKRGIKTEQKAEKGVTIIDKDFGKFVRYKGFMLPDQVYKLMSKFEDFKIRTDDVFVVSFPKSGTTWVQEIVFLLMTGADFVSAKERTIEERFPFLEYPCPGLDVLNTMESPRLIKTHLPYSLLSKQMKHTKPKIIYIARNPRDVTVSYFHFCKTITFLGFRGDFSQFFSKFMNDLVPYAPWFQHVKEFSDHQEDENILFITYEELHEDIIGSIRRIAKFLEKPISNEDLVRVAAFCSFRNMKDNKSSNYSWLEETGLKGKGDAFMRKGKVGDWKNYFSSDMCERMDEKVKENFDGTRLTFIYDDIAPNKYVLRRA